MNILIVDDQPNIISALVSNIPWTKIGITSVYTAVSSYEAKQIISDTNIDILLTDIEMPVENGIFLLQWAREHGHQFECIFLTSHPDFHYIRQALKLDACDYVLQPAKYSDIQASIEKAVEKRNLSKSQKEYLRLGKFAFESRNDFLCDIFKDWFSGVPVDISERCQRLTQFGIELVPESPVMLAYLHIISWQAPPVRIRTMLDGTWSVVTDVFKHMGMQCSSFCMDETNIFFLLYADKSTRCTISAHDFQSLKRYWDSAASQIQQKYPCTFQLFTGKVIPFESLAVAHANICDAVAASSITSSDPFSLPKSSVQIIDLQKPVSGIQGNRFNKNAVFEKVLSYINSNLDKPISCTDIANYIYLSPDYITRIIREKEGKTLKQLITQLKMEKAKLLLTATQKPIGDIALELGFSSSSHFSSVYKSYYGISPNKYRK